MDPIKALDEIEHATKSIHVNANLPTGADWFESHWKPKFDAIRKALEPPSTLLLDFMSDEELLEIGYTHEEVDMGIMDDIDQFYFCDGEPYSFTHHLVDATYEIKENVTFRGKTWDTLVIVWH